MSRCDNLGGLGEHVTCHMCFGFLVDFFVSFSILGISLRHRPWTDFDDLYVMWRDSAHTDVPFGGPVVTIFHLLDQILSKTFIWDEYVFQA